MKKLITEEQNGVVVKVESGTGYMCHLCGDQKTIVRSIGAAPGGYYIQLCHSCAKQIANLLIDHADLLPDGQVAVP